MSNKHHLRRNVADCIGGPGAAVLSPSTSCSDTPLTPGQKTVPVWSQLYSNITAHDTDLFRNNKLQWRHDSCQWNIVKNEASQDSTLILSFQLQQETDDSTSGSSVSFKYQLQYLYYSDFMQSRVVMKTLELNYAVRLWDDISCY